jgi:hypothetical protein
MISSSKYTYTDHAVHDRLYFAELRLVDLHTLNGGDFGGAPARERQALLQEFFFHLCGAIDFLAQEVNIIRHLALGEDNVNVSAVCRKLTRTDPVLRLLTELHPRVRLYRDPVPPDLYSEEGAHYRITVFRNFVAHIRHNPVSINVFLGSPHASSAHLFLDPRLPHTPIETRTPSKRPVLDELDLFLALVRPKCDLALIELGIPTS